MAVTTTPAAELDAVFGGVDSHADTIHVAVVTDRGGHVADDATARQRLGIREIGSQLDSHVIRSIAMAQHLEATAPPWVARVCTDGRSVTDIARDAIAATNWSAQSAQAPDHDLRLEY
ncbi:hypothetical protein GCM10020000_81050 [Streptomyces olivoverticillatus]